MRASFFGFLRRLLGRDERQGSRDCSRTFSKAQRDLVLVDLAELEKHRGVVTPSRAAALARARRLLTSNGARVPDARFAEALYEMLYASLDARLPPLALHMVVRPRIS